MNITSPVCVIPYSLTAAAVIAVSLLNPAKAETTLSPGVTTEGLACNVLHTPNGKKRWSILQYDLNEGTNSPSVVYSTRHDKVIQSVACSADGSKILFAMQERVGEDSEIYQLDTGNPDYPIPLTDNASNDIDVAMNQAGTTLVWQGELEDSRQAITIRSQQSDGSYDTTQLSGQYGYTQPYLSPNGEWLIMLQRRPKVTNVVRYQLSSQSYTVVATLNNGRQQLSNPSISNDGNQALWLEMGAEQKLVLTDLTTGERNIPLRKEPSGNLIEHPSLMGDGQGILYSVNGQNKRQTFIHVISTGLTVRLGNTLKGDSRYLSNQLHASLTFERFDLNVTATNGSVSVSPASDEGYLPGTALTLTANADDGFEFVEWLGAAGCQQQLTCSLIVSTQDLAITAGFKKINFKIDWSTVIPTAGHGYSTGIAKGPDDMIYVVGGSGSGCFGSNSSAFLVKYDSEGGQQLWLKLLNNEDYTALDVIRCVEQVAVDELGYVYIGGSASVDGDFLKEAFLIKFDPNGVKVWEQILETDNYSSSLYDLTLDPLGGVYIAGNSSNQELFNDATCLVPGCEPDTQTRVFIAHYDEHGERSYLKFYSGGLAASRPLISTDPSGNVVIGIGAPATYSYRTELPVIKLNHQGEFIWLKSLLPEGSSAEIMGLNVDSSGSTFVTFESEEQIGEQHFGNSDVVIIKLNTDGELQYVNQIGTSSYDYPNGTALDSEGNLYVAVRTYGSFDHFHNVYGNSGRLLLKYSSEGVLVDAYEFDGSTIGDIYEVVLGTNGDFYLAGYIYNSGSDTPLVMRVSPE